VSLPLFDTVAPGLPEFPLAKVLATTDLSS